MDAMARPKIAERGARQRFAAQIRLERTGVPLPTINQGQASTIDRHAGAKGHRRDIEVCLYG
jgi:hypothetical protein